MPYPELFGFAIGNITAQTAPRCLQNNKRILPPQYGGPRPAKFGPIGEGLTCNLN